MSDKRGLFITFEGIDGSGKSTQIRRLRDFLETNGHSVELIREPGGTAIGEKIRSLLLDKSNGEMSFETELLLYEAARAQIVNEKIVPSIRAGKVVVCDRFFDSTTAYQGYARGLDLSEINRLNRWATGGLEPDITFLMDLPVTEAMKRMVGRSGGSDRLEVEGSDFMEKVREGYLAILTRNPRMILLDATDSADTIFQKVQRIVWEVMNK
ncbi:MAG: dTMP kinase [Clostridiaceae bacterium]|nr:dTMP kinase [Oscillospiraceae bacterium]NLO63569.1 dTMP kinase [Clostridiaceae bacterium]